MQMPARLIRAWKLSSNPDYKVTPAATTPIARSRIAKITTRNIVPIPEPAHHPRRNGNSLHRSAAIRVGNPPPSPILSQSGNRAR